MEQTAGRALRNQGMWYHHFKVSHGYTNRGEVLGSSIVLEVIHIFWIFKI